ncbi:hypothetical protein [Phytoactinopolyspora halotolerans]|uniref:ATP synthase subunit I n=1 Tax=Phytoactinopolyspora halotolerans TaxID=1981512 RepID=A0A6L9S5Y1_9ACTN|nr:hypothetical protein [Phytoactinopolyspora halotolerans]NEE00566.1 hypothetical protein [Phytoactinopolyspora halotolerans]
MSEPTTPPGVAAFVTPMRRVLTTAGAGLAVLLPVGTAVGWALGGSGVGLGILLGLAIPAAFFGGTVLTGVWAARMDNTRFVGVVVGSWLAKIVILMVIMALIKDAEFFARTAFFIAFVVGVVGWLAAECIVVLRTRVPYLDISPNQPPTSVDGAVEAEAGETAQRESRGV